MLRALQGILHTLGCLSVLALLVACEPTDTGTQALQLTDQEVENLVTRSYPYVAMYNVNNKFAAAQGGWNTLIADTRLKDHTLRDIARPNNDTFYISALLDLRVDGVVLDIPVFDSDYASLMITGYDHHVNIPMATRLGDFDKPERMLIYSERTDAYDGSKVEGIDRYFEATGDFVSAVIRVVPHQAEPDRMARIVEQAKKVSIETLAEFRGEPPLPCDPPAAPPFGATDLDVFETNLLEVMQFVFNHTTFHPEHPDDQALLAAYEPLGVAPGHAFDPERVIAVDGARMRAKAREIQQFWLGRTGDLEAMEAIRPRIFQPKGETDLEAVVAVSVIGPIGIPQDEAVYPQIVTADGVPMNAMYDYVIRMGPDEMPPARAFWSVTLYDMDEGFFIANDRKKYSVGLNGGMQLDESGGIEIYIAAERPDGVPLENWLPIDRVDLDLAAQMRLYVPDLEAYEDWTPPVAERVGG
jgi:hypothetical protein